MKRRNTNSAWVWAATGAVHAVAMSWLGWRGLVVAAAAFGVGVAYATSDADRCSSCDARPGEMHSQGCPLWKPPMIDAEPC